MITTVIARKPCDAAISWYDPSVCCAEIKMLPGDCHGPKGPRNDTVVVGELRSLYKDKHQFISPTKKENDYGK